MHRETSKISTYFDIDMDRYLKSLTNNDPEDSELASLHMPSYIPKSIKSLGDNCLKE